MSGTTTFSSITTSGSVNIGTTQANAILYLNGKKAVAGTDAWLRLNDTTAFTSGIYCGTGLLRTDGQFQLGSSGAKLAFTSTNDNSNIAGASGGHALFKIPIEMNGTSYYWDTSGNIKANDVNSSTGQINNLFVPNELRALSYSIETINSLGGAFYVAPTINVPAGNNVNITAISGTTITASISGSFSLTTFPQAIWAANSKVKVTGKIGGIPIGTCDGYLRNALTASSIQVTFTYDGTKALTVANNQASEDVSVMIYSVGSDKPIGIYMTAWGDTAWSDETAHNKSSISIYGGTTSSDTAPTTSTPVVRIGNLTGLPNISSGQITVQPQGWGIYTTHGYFSGSVVTNEGLIGGFTLYNNKLYTTNNTLGQGTDNVYLSTDGISLGTKFQVTKAGALTSTSGTIGGWTIGADRIWSGNFGVANSAMVSVGTSTAGTDTKSIGGSSAINGWTFTSGAKFGVTKEGVLYCSEIHATGAINATSGTIGSNGTSGNRWQIGSTSIYNGTSSPTVNSNTVVGTYIGTDGILNYASANAYVLLKDGVITAQGANITGTIHATGGEFGDANGYHVAVSSSDVGIYSDASTKIASYGTATTIGKQDDNYLYLDSQSFGMYGYRYLSTYGTPIIGRVSFFTIEDLKDKTVTINYVGDGDSADFELYGVKTISSVTINSTATSSYSKTTNGIHFTTAPADGDVIAVQYIPEITCPYLAMTSTIALSGNHGIWSTSLGLNAWCTGAYSFAQGNGARGNGTYSFAAGYNAIASNFGSVAIGYNAQSTGSQSVAIGDSMSTGLSSFAESTGVAYGDFSHAEGCNTEATGEGAHSAGGFSVASGDYSFAGNFNTVAQRRSQTVLGEWNIADTGGTDETTRGSYAFIIGNGSATTESNALTVDWDGQLMAHGGIAGHGAYTGGRLTNANLGELGGDFKVGGTGMRYFIASSSMSSNKPTFKNLIGISYSNSDSAVLHLPWDYDNGYDTQIAIQNNGGSLAIRGGNGATNGVQNWNAWSSLAMVGDFNPISIAFSHTSTAYAGTHQCWAYRVGNIFIAQIGFNITTNPPQGSYQTVGKFTLPKNINKDLLMIQPCSSGGNLMVNIQPDGTTRIYKYSGTCSGWIRGLMVGMWSQ